MQSWFSKQKLYMALVSLCGIAVFALCVYQSIALYQLAASKWDFAVYCGVMVVILTMCHMLPIYITADKTMEISFVPVVACIVTKGVPISIVLYALSSLFVMLQDGHTKKYYSPWRRAPFKELFNVANDHRFTNLHWSV